MITSATVDYVRNVLLTHAGLVLPKECAYLIESRLLPIARDQRISSVTELIRAAQGGSIPDPEQLLAEAMSDGETCFCRDARVFECLKQKILPDLVSRCGPERRLSLWSLGCSTGQEAYSLALLLRENFPELAEWHVRLDGSDFSREALGKAAAGGYNQLEINRGLPLSLLVKHFERGSALWRVIEPIRQSVRFFQMNVLDEWPGEESFDLILFRYVLSAMTPDAATECLQEICRHLHPGGYLVIGANEKLPPEQRWFEELKFEKVACYRPRPDARQHLFPRRVRQKSQAKVCSSTPASAWDVPELGEVLMRNPQFAELLIQAANRRRHAEEDEIKSLEEALRQLSPQQAVAALLREHLAKALSNVFEAMVCSSLDLLDPASVGRPQKLAFTGMAQFSGKAPAVVAVELDQNCAGKLAGLALGLEPQDVPPEIAREMISQTMAMVATNLNEALVKIGWECALGEIQIIEGPTGLSHIPAKAAREALAFRFQDEVLWAEVFATPATEKTRGN